MRSSLRAKLYFLVAVLVTASIGVLHSHDLFLKAEHYRVAPHSSVRVHVLNGTFSSSEAAVVWQRVANSSLVGPRGSRTVDSTAWLIHGDTNQIAVHVEESGTYLLGIS